MQNPMVLIETTSGDILVELFEKEAPQTVINFLQYVDDDFYNSTIFHRVIKDFMIQGGGLTMRMEEKETRPPIQNEAHNGLKNIVGTIAMARTSDPHSATSQFFINLEDNPELDFTEATQDGFGYCVFGQVVDGIDTVNKIAKIKVKVQGDYEAVPVDSIVITGTSRFEL